MSEMGQTRPSGDVRAMSALARFADLTLSAAMSHKCQNRT
jgi:hypothetical protein